MMKNLTRSTAASDMCFTCTTTVPSSIIQTHFGAVGGDVDRDEFLYLLFVYTVDEDKKTTPNQ